jgi:hypothetical protein
MFLFLLRRMSPFLVLNGPTGQPAADSFGGGECVVQNRPDRVPGHIVILGYHGVRLLSVTFNEGRVASVNRHTHCRGDGKIDGRR